VKVGDLVKLNKERVIKHSYAFDDRYIKTLGDCTGILVESKEDFLDFPELPAEELFTVLFRNGKKITLSKAWLMPVENEE